MIDEEQNAGSVIISSIGKPEFVGFDFYKKMYNCTFEEDCTMDFRYYPNLGNTLSKTSSSYYDVLDL